MSLTEPRVRRPWALAYGLWGIPVVAWTILLIVQVATHPFVPRWAIPAIGAPLDGVAAVLFIGRRLEKRRLAVVATREAEEAAELRTPRAPDAGPDQCPVCGGYGLDELAADDAFMDRGERAKVVPWGRKRAHRDCAEFVPYVPTAEEKARDTHFRDHHGTWRTVRCDWCFVEDERWEEAAPRRRFERSWPELLEPACAGDRSIRLSKKPDPGLRYWLAKTGAPSRHMDLLVFESCERASYGPGFTARLAEPLRHGLFVTLNLPNRITPLEPERLWNQEAGRPFTRMELGLCDCQAPPSYGVTIAQVSSVLRAMGTGY